VGDRNAWNQKVSEGTVIMSGFFWPEKKNVGVVRDNRNKKIGCLYCKLKKTCKNPRLSETGKGGEGIVIVSDFPSSKEDNRGKLLLQQSKEKILSDALENRGISLKQDCIYTKALLCKPTKDKVDKLDVLHCREIVFQQITKHKPKLIILLGDQAIESYLNERFSNRSKLPISHVFRGFCIPDHDLGCWVACCYGLRELVWALEDRRKKVMFTIFNADIAIAISHLKKKLPKPISEDDVELTEEKQTIEQLKKWTKGSLTAFDYETTGKKPYSRGHKIFTCGISDGKRTIAFLLTPAIKPHLIKYLRSKKAKKIAQNMKFEHVWGLVCLKTRTLGWVWDTMLNAHILDNRKGITGLKFQNIINFGLFEYDKYIKPFFKTKYSNGINNIHKADRRELLIYNGLDALSEFRLAKKQAKIMGQSL
jgi:uracil-DNA glycosylase family 4